MAALSVQTPSSTGAALTYSAASASDTFYNDGRTFLHVINAHGSIADTVTANSLVVCNQGVDHNWAVVVAFGTNRMIGPFPIARFNDTDNLVTVTHSSTASVTVAVIRGG